MVRGKSNEGAYVGFLLKSLSCVQFSLTYVFKCHRKLRHDYSESESSYS